MMLALGWLTISAPFVYKAQQEKNGITKAGRTLPVNGDEEDASNPFSNTTEEKTSTNLNTLSEEYLHHTDIYDHSISVSSAYFKTANVKAYIAFHGELLSPPPEA